MLVIESVLAMPLVVAATITFAGLVYWMRGMRVVIPDSDEDPEGAFVKRLEKQGMVLIGTMAFLVALGLLTMGLTNIFLLLWLPLV